MKNYYLKIIMLFLVFFGLFYGFPVKASLPLQGKVIVVVLGEDDVN